MTLSRYQLVFLIGIVVIAAGVGITVWYVEHIFKEREDFIEKVKKGDPEEIAEKPPERPREGPPPLERSTSRDVEVLAVSVGAPATRKMLSIRGNGEFTRLPALPDEPGPLVTGLLDRARTDELMRIALAPATPGADHAVVTVRMKDAHASRAVDRAEARAFLEIVGKQTNRKAIPERVSLVTAPADPGPAIPWPFERATPDSFEKGAGLMAAPDKVGFREGVLRLLEKDARFSFKDKFWKVVAVDLLPPPAKPPTSQPSSR